MRGSHYFEVHSKRESFEFTIRRNITILQGNSGTGKSTLLHMLYESLLLGKQSGYHVSCDVPYYVYLRGELGRSWEDTLSPLHDTIIFIEENNEFVQTNEFARFARESGNYFVLVTRVALPNLPYSVHEIYKMSDGRLQEVYPAQDSTSLQCSHTDVMCTI